MVEPHQRHDSHFGIEVQKNRQAAGLKIEIDQRYSLMQRSECQREVGGERGDADAADQADDRNYYATFAALGAPAGFAYFQQSTGGLAGVERHEQNLVGTGAQRSLNQPGGPRREHGKQAWARRMQRLTLQKTQGSLFV